MSRLILGGAALVMTATLLTLSPVHGQQKPPPPQPEPVNIATSDGVKLKGIFYPSNIKGAPTVIMLHPIGEGKSMRMPEWKNLAEELQKNGYAVMTFDFRGHGDSTSIDEKKLFWSKPANASCVKTKDQDTIDVRDYIKQAGAYLPILVNDIAAVRSYLDRRNDDTKDCNTSSLLVVGAEAGATLGALWINSEWSRFKFMPNPNPMLAPIFSQGSLSDKSEGHDIIGAVFLTISPSLGKRTVRVDTLLKRACKDQAMAAAFFCGKTDTKARDFAKGLERTLKPKKDSKKHEFIGAVELGTNLAGAKLLQKGLGTDKLITKYLDSVVEERKYERVDRDFLNTYFVWKLNNGVVPARNKKSDKTLNFDDYGKFFSQ